MKKKIFAVMLAAMMSLSALAGCSSDTPTTDDTVSNSATDPAADPATDGATDPATDGATDPAAE